MTISFRALIVVFAVGVSSQAACAWGREGHEIVATIAENNLDTAAKAAVHEILATEGQTSMAAVSSWADDVRDLDIPKQPMHSVRIPLDDSGYDAAKDCPTKVCVVAAIDYYRDALKAGKLTTDAKAVALKYIIHMVGDVHQPLHANLDTGDWTVTMAGKPVTLHKIWDTEIIRSRKEKSRELVDEIVAAGPKDGEKQAAADLSVEDWAIETRNLARDKVYVGVVKRPADLKGPLFERGAESGLTLPDSYYDDNWPIVETQLRVAGYRLAALLNDIFDRKAAD